MANQVKNLHCKEARDFHVKPAVGITSLPQNPVAYADFTENRPVSSRDHLISSGTSSWAGSQVPTTCHSVRNSCRVSRPKFGAKSIAQVPLSMAEQTNLYL